MEDIAALDGEHSQVGIGRQGAGGVEAFEFGGQSREKGVGGLCDMDVWRRRAGPSSGPRSRARRFNSPARSSSSVRVVRMGTLVDVKASNLATSCALATQICVLAI
jgi:hypothetical protein